MTGKRKALIVANDEYEDPSLGLLRSPVEDARALGVVLGDPRIGAFEVAVVRNEPAHLVHARIEDFFLDARPEDLLVLHFSCHGLKSDSGELFFAARNTRPRRLGSTAVAADFVRRCMRASRSRSLVLFLDCCYGGAFAEGAAVRASGEVNVLDSFGQGGRGQAVITASTSMEYAFEGDRLSGGCDPQPSVFTRALVEGLTTGDADRDEDGQVSLDELYEYVFDRVRDQNPNQTPSRSFDLQGELYLARSSRRRIRPIPVPPDLRAAMTDSSIFARRGAITELRSRLTSDNLPVAAGARDALQEMAHNDIEYVAANARDALHDAAVHPAEQQLNFGRVAQNSTPSRTVQLLGPPLARACAFQVTQDRIHVAQSGTGLQISLDTSHQGEIQGDIILKDPVEEAVIRVDADVIPAPPSDGRPPPPVRQAPAPPSPGRPSPDSPAAQRKETPRPMAAPMAAEAPRPASGGENPPTHPKAIWALVFAAASVALLFWSASVSGEVFRSAWADISHAIENWDQNDVSRSIAPIFEALTEVGKVLLGGAVGIFLSIRARGLAKRSNDAISASGGRYGGQDLNRAAMVISWVAIALAVLMLLTSMGNG
ncbi:caspase, EACC1-associated type [Streptosporangium sp. KLBMP 9127]|nr:caspase family protein [Streptosporangium sp. KLBMP 9127]